MANHFACSDSEFNNGLDSIGRIISKMLREKDTEEYFTTAYLVFPDKVVLKLLMEPLGASAEEGYQVLLAFGKHLSQDQPVPQAAFVATQAVRPDRSEYIWISGCTPDGRKNVGELSISLSANNSIRPGEYLPTYYEASSGDSEEQTLAYGLIQGFLKGSSRQNN